MTPVAERATGVGDQEVSVDNLETRPRKRFETIPAIEQPVVGDDADIPASRRGILSRRGAMTLGGVMLFGAVGGFVCAGQVAAAKGETEVATADAARIADLQSQIKLAQTRQAALPSAAESERALVTALQAGTEVAHLQNDYRILAGKVSDGRLDKALVTDTGRDLTPHFAQSVDQSALDPWYLLATDIEVPVGTGLPADFRSGFSWVAQVPHGIDDTGMVNVTWLAVASTPGAHAQPEVLAWAQADYDMIRNVFLDVQVATSAPGEQQRLEATIS